MSDNKKIVKRLIEVPRCFVRYGGEYRLHDIKLNLPKVHVKYEEALTCNEKIEYRYITFERDMKKEVFCQYWNKEFFQEVEVLLPTYEFSNGNYYYIGKYISKVPTKRTILAALDLKVEVDDTVKKIKYFYNVQAIEKYMESRCVAYTKKGQFKGNLSEGRYENFYVFTNDSDIIIFDLDKVYTEPVILQLPEYLIPRVLGKKNCHAKRWVDTLGLKQLEVEPI